MNPKIVLVEVDPGKYSDLLLLYRCLAERPKRANISHDGKLPKWEDHVAYVKKNPYIKKWFIIKVCVEKQWMSCGNVYLTNKNEIGIAVLKQYQRCGIAETVLRRVIRENGKEPLFANIAPHNYPSQRLFKKLGFVHIQNTYKRLK